MVELVKKYEFKVRAVTLIPSDGGTFEVTVDDTLIYSKLSTGRHPHDGEVDQLIQGLL
jgi:selenoprotein W-related protein